MTTLNNVHDSKGKLYVICPFIRKIEYLLSQENIPIEILFEITRHQDSIRQIASYYQGENECGEVYSERIYEPYNFSQAIRQIKLLATSGKLTEEKIDEVIRTYI